MSDSEREIEITPEMIEAGAEALTLWDDGAESSLIVRSVFSAMLAVSPRRARRPEFADRAP